MSKTINIQETSEQVAFRIRPRLLMLLGDQLIRDASLAVFELVKNAYDADATECSVTVNLTQDAESTSIVIEDNGCGMDEEILRHVWMVIATDFRANQRAKKQRTPIFNRFPLGEKGLGRLSIHKLGKFITLVTRIKNGEELVMKFNWDELEKAKDLESAGVTLRRRTPKTFLGNRHGTNLTVTHLRETWARGELRRLHRAVNSLCSPFDGPTDFVVTLAAPNNEAWLEGMFAADAARECATYRVSGSFSGSEANFEYSFSPPPGYSKQLSSRTQKSVISLQSKNGRNSVPLDLSQHQIGKVNFDFWLFDRDPAVLRSVTEDVKGLKDYLDENGGIRIYRDGIRVYDFGEPGNDWLNLDMRRINTPTAKTSNNQILGALKLDATESGSLREKSNREGFIENKAFADFREAVICVLTQVEAEKSKDQKRVREVTGRGTGQNVFTKLVELRAALDEKGVLPAVETKLKAVERELETYRDQLLHAAVPGLTLGIMLHGAEKILDELRIAARKPNEHERVLTLVDRLYRAMRPVTNLLKNPGTTSTSAFSLINEAIFSVELRLKRHDIKLINGIESGNPDFTLKGSKQMLIASITNLLDNSIHWLETKNAVRKVIYLGTSKDLVDGPVIVVGDNGPGFGNDAPEDLITPFFTRRNGGMGLGLYIVSEVMRVNGGRLVFPSDGDLSLPNTVDGAVVALQFQGGK